MNVLSLFLSNLSKAMLLLHGLAPPNAPIIECLQNVWQHTLMLLNTLMVKKSFQPILHLYVAAS
jgi:hypothetical protein